MVDDDDAVMVAKRPGEEDDPVGRDHDLRRRAPWPASARATHPAGVDRAQAFDDARRRPEGDKRAAAGGIGPSAAAGRGRRAEPGNLGRDLRRRAAALRFARQLLDVLAAGQQRRRRRRPPRRRSWRADCSARASSCGELAPPCRAARRGCEPTSGATRRRRVRSRWPSASSADSAAVRSRITGRLASSSRRTRTNSPARIAGRQREQRRPAPHHRQPGQQARRPAAAAPGAAGGGRPISRR